MPRIRMTDEDRALYGGPEWVEIDLSELIDERAELIDHIERDFGMTPTEFLNGVRRDARPALRAVMWCALYKAGVRVDARTFRPVTQPYSGVRYEATEKELATAVADADPPAPTPANRATRRAATKATTKAAPRKRTTTARSKS